MAPKLFIIFLLVTCTTGCFHQTVSSQDIADATKICEARNTKVMEITALLEGTEIVVCSNRVSYKISAENLK